MDDKDKKKFIDDFKKADIEKKLDMWYFALDQEAFWEELITEMSDLAQKQQLTKKTSIK